MATGSVGEWIRNASGSEKRKVKGDDENGKKEQPTELIQGIVAGKSDPSGNKIVHVLAKFNEFAIYEIDHSDINNRLRVIIDGHTNESERGIQEKFHQVKQKYIQAKGLLYRSSNYGMMKNRVAHILATCLSSSTVDGNKAFDELIAVIEKEHESIVENRAVYLLPALAMTVATAFVALWNMNDRYIMATEWQVFTAVLGASLGGSISILMNIKSLHFEEFRTKRYYALIGLERILLSYIAGAIAFIAIKAGLTLPALAKGGYWAMMMVMVVAAFSESFVPSVLGKVERDMV